MKSLKKLVPFILCFALVAVITAFNAPQPAQAVESEVTVEEIKSALSGYTMLLTVNGSEQRFEVKEKEISKVTVKSQKLSSDGKSLTVKGTVLVDRKVATVKASFTVKFKLKNDAWKESGVTFKNPSISKIPVKGTWKGICDFRYSGEAAFTIKVDKISKDGFITAGTASFGPTPTHKQETGSYSITGGFDTKTGKVCFWGGDWIERPGSWTVDNFEMYVDLVNEKLTGSANGNSPTTLEKAK